MPRGRGGRVAGGRVPTWQGVGRRTWGPLGVGNLEPASGLCLQSWPWFRTLRGRGRRGCSGCFPRPRPSSRQLTWAPRRRRRRRLPRSAPPARLRWARRGRALLSAAPAGARGAGAGGAAGSGLGRDAAAGCAKIGCGRWEPRHGAARARRAPPRARPRAGEGREAGAAETKVAARRREGRRKGRRRRGGK